MTGASKTLMALEHELYQRDKWAWAVYTALRHAPDRQKKATLWAMLTADQQEALKILANHVDETPHKNYDAPELPLHSGPTHDHYGKRL